MVFCFPGLRLQSNFFANFTFWYLMGLVYSPSISCTFTEGVAKYLHSTILSFKFCGYVQRANKQNAKNEKEISDIFISFKNFSTALKSSARLLYAATFDLKFMIVLSFLPQYGSTLLKIQEKIFHVSQNFLLKLEHIIMFYVLPLNYLSPYEGLIVVFCKNQLKKFCGFRSKPNSRNQAMPVFKIS